MSGQTPDEVLKAIAATEVEPAHPASAYTVEMQNPRATETSGLVRANHALQAVRQADGLKAYEYGGAAIFMATAAIATAGRMFVILAMGRDDGEQRVVTDAFRIVVASPDELERLSKDPSLAFQALLERYAIPYANPAGEGQVLFLPAILLPRKESDADVHSLMDRLVQEIGLLLDRDLRVVCMVRVEEDTTRFFWTFVFAVERYSRDVSAGRR